MDVYRTPLYQIIIPDRETDPNAFAEFLSNYDDTRSNQYLFYVEEYVTSKFSVALCFIEYQDANNTFILKNSTNDPMTYGDINMVFHEQPMYDGQDPAFYVEYIYNLPIERVIIGDQFIVDTDYIGQDFTQPILEALTLQVILKDDEDGSAKEVNIYNVPEFDEAHEEGDKVDIARVISMGG